MMMAPVADPVDPRHFAPREFVIGQLPRFPQIDRELLTMIVGVLLGQALVKMHEPSLRSHVFTVVACALPLIGQFLRTPIDKKLQMIFIITLRVGHVAALVEKTLGPHIGRPLASLLSMPVATIVILHRIP